MPPDSEAAPPALPAPVAAAVSVAAPGAAITDAVEGLILTDVVTMGDFEPRNNFLRRDVVWNPDGLLDGARHAAPSEEPMRAFVGINDPDVDAALATARSGATPEERQAAAEEINRIFAEKCYQIPTTWTLWGTPHKPNVKGLGTWVLPDGTPSRDGAGFSGQFWVHTLWVQQ